MTRSNVEKRLDLAVAPSSPSVPKPSKQAHLTAHHPAHGGHASLQSGVAFNIIALWLGHESPNTTHRYVEADLAMKEKALARLDEPSTRLPSLPSARRLAAVPAAAITMESSSRLWRLKTAGSGSLPPHS